MRVDMDTCEEILVTITRNKTRSLLTAFGVFWGIFMLTVMLGAGMGLGRLFRAQLGDMSTNTLLMQPQQTGLPLWAYLAIGAAVIVVLVVLVVVVRKKKKAAALAKLEEGNDEDI